MGSLDFYISTDWKNICGYGAFKPIGNSADELRLRRNESTPQGNLLSPQLF